VRALRMVGGGRARRHSITLSARARSVGGTVSFSRYGEV